MMKCFNCLILLISGFLVLVSNPCGAETLKILERGQNGGKRVNVKGNENSTNSELMDYFRDVTSRTLGSSQIFDTLQNQIYDAITNITLIASGLGNDIQGTVKNQTGNGENCSQVAAQIWEAVKIPIFVIAPAVIIGVVVFIKIIGLIAAWLPSVTAPWFNSLKSSWNTDSDSDSGWGGTSGGWPSPSSGYGTGPSAPSPGYGTPGGLSRQTSILEAIENMSNIYGNGNANGNQNQPYSQQIPSNLPGELGNYGEQQQQLPDYQGGQSLQNSVQPQAQAPNNYPYYYYRDPNLSLNPIDYSNSNPEKTNLGNLESTIPLNTGTANQVG